MLFELASFLNEVLKVCWAGFAGYILGAILMAIFCQPKAKKNENVFDFAVIAVLFIVPIIIAALVSLIQLAIFAYVFIAISPETKIFLLLPICSILVMAGLIFQNNPPHVGTPLAKAGWPMVGIGALFGLVYSFRTLWVCARHFYFS